MSQYNLWIPLLYYGRLRGTVPVTPTQTYSCIRHFQKADNMNAKIDIFFSIQNGEYFSVW
jgi:hypothetical protein